MGVACCLAPGLQPFCTLTSLCNLPSPVQLSRSPCPFFRRRAHAMTDGFNALEGVTCTFTEGAM